MSRFNFQTTEYCFRCTGKNVKVLGKAQTVTERQRHTGQRQLERQFQKDIDGKTRDRKTRDRKTRDRKTETLHDLFRRSLF